MTKEQVFSLASISDPTARQLAERELSETGVTVKSREGQLFISQVIAVGINNANPPRSNKGRSRNN